MSEGKIVVPVTIEQHQEGGYLAVCEEIQGCHAAGDTIQEAVQNIEEVAEMMWELCTEKHLPMPPLLAGYRPGISIEARIVNSEQASPTNG